MSEIQFEIDIENEVVETEVTVDSTEIVFEVEMG